MPCLSTPPQTQCKICPAACIYLDTTDTLGTLLTSLKPPAATPPPHPQKQPTHTHTCVIWRLSWLPRRMVILSLYRTLSATSSVTVSTLW